MPLSAGCLLSLEPEKVMVTCRELRRLSSLPGAVSGDAVPDAEQCSRSFCHGAHRAAGHRNPMGGHSRRVRRSREPLAGAEHPGGEGVRWEHRFRAVLSSNKKLLPLSRDSQGNLPRDVVWENQGHIFPGHGDFKDLSLWFLMLTWLH